MTNIVIKRRRPSGGVDVTGPVISNVFSAPGAVAFDTDEPATSVIEYGSSFAAVMTALDPIAWWRLGEDSGTSAAEEIGSATGSYVNTPSLDQPGIVGGDTAVTFARASSEHVYVATGMPVGSTTGASIAAWVEFGSTTFDESHYFVSWGPQSSSTGYHSFHARHFDADSFMLYWEYADGTSYRTAWMDWTTDTPTGQHLVVATHAYNSTGGTILFYVDGALLGTKVHSAYATPLQVPADAVTYLASYNATLHCLNGTLDEPAVWDRVLTPTEIGDLWDAQASSDFAYSYTDAVLRTAHSYSIISPYLDDGWAYRIKATDASGNLTTSSTYTVASTPTWGSLQDAIDGTADYGTCDVSGYRFNDAVTVDRPMTITGGTAGATLSVGAGTTAITVTASNVTIDNLTINGPQYHNFIEHERAIYIGVPVNDFTVTDCTISSFGNAGMWLDRVSTGLTITGNAINGVAYAGMMICSAGGGTISGNTITHIGEGYGSGGSRTDPDSGWYVGDNAYGIAVTTHQTPSIRPSNVTISGNIIEDMPYWEGLDTHAGIDLVFESNILRRVRRGVMLTTTAAGQPTRIIVRNNRMEAPVTTYDPRAVICYRTIDCQIINNQFHSTYPINNQFTTSPGDNRVYDYTLASTGLTVSGNTVI